MGISYLSTMLNKDEYILLGYISKAHGLNGEVRAVMDVYDIEEYLGVQQLHLQNKSGKVQLLEVEEMKPQAKKQLMLRFKEVKDRSTAEHLIGSSIYFPLTALPELESGHFYYFEVIGFDVEDQRLGKLGKVKDFIDGTNHDLMVMEYLNQEVLIPVIDQFVLRADKAAQCIFTQLPEGLVELYTQTEEQDPEA